MLRLLLLVAGFVFTQLALCQSELIGYRQYPQFRTTSGMPGSGMPVDEAGRLGPRGAISLSIPVGYSFARDNYLLGGSFTGDSLGFSSENTTDFGNGTAWALAGFDGRWGRATIGYMVLSGTLDNVVNLQYQPPIPGKVGYSVGVQDLVGDGGASGDAIDDVEHLSSRSFFVAGTYPATERVHVTAGLGTNRFRFGFAGASWNINDSVSVYGEHDGFNFNVGIAWHPQFSRQYVGGLNLGLIRGKYLFVGLTFGF